LKEEKKKSKDGEKTQKNKSKIGGRGRDQKKNPLTCRADQTHSVHLGSTSLLPEGIGQTQTTKLTHHNTTRAASQTLVREQNKEKRAGGGGGERSFLQGEAV